MTKFERDLRTIITEGDDAREILVKRASEIDKLTDELRACRNGFRAKCIKQDLTRLKREYNELEANF